MGLGKLNPGCGCECDGDAICDMYDEGCRIRWECDYEGPIRVTRNGIVISTASSGIITKPQAGTYRLETCVQTSLPCTTWIERKAISIPGPVNYSSCYPGQNCCQQLNNQLPTSSTFSGFPSPLASSFTGTYGLTSYTCLTRYVGLTGIPVIYEYIEPHAFYPRRFRLYRGHYYQPAKFAIAISMAPDDGIVGSAPASASWQFVVSHTWEEYNAGTWTRIGDTSSQGTTSQFFHSTVYPCQNTFAGTNSFAAYNTRAPATGLNSIGPVVQIWPAFDITWSMS